MKAIILFLFTITSCIISAQNTPPTTLPAPDTTFLDKTIKWFEDKGFSIRKSFDATSKEEQKPANILWNNDYENNVHYFTIDVGAKIGELPLLNHSNSILIIYPKFEWHKDSPPAKDKQKNTVGYGANLEFFFQKTKGPFLMGSYEYKDDKVKVTGTSVFKGFLSYKGNRNFEPGAHTRNAKADFIFRYYPYSGVEYYKNTIGNKEIATMWANRLFFELYPVPSFYRNYIQLTFDYTYRTIIKDNLYNLGNLCYLSLGLNIYPGGEGKLGIGFDYSKGQDPSANFVGTDKLSLGLKIKL